MLQITDPTDTPPRFALFQLGFRPFFLAASLFAVFGTLAWVALYNFQWVGLPATYPPMLWHAHEMVFAYALAVIAGFLLTAVKNWTGLPTLHGYSLAGLFGLWFIARLLPFTGLQGNRLNPAI
ncbi:NnrS family protein [Thiofilum flexile]|uniref:NnrS family protein n=1 Tax=Thiofilum flexile TaxID=125627 RepID=UPI00037FD744|nr:NnrS family protein [Thiofilum flexile]